VVVGVDKARNDDSVRAVDQGYVARRDDLGAYLANLAVLDQDVAFGEVPDLGIEGEEDSPLDEDPPRTLRRTSAASSASWALAALERV
jgi:hypothetical protein